MFITLDRLELMDMTIPYHIDRACFMVPAAKVKMLPLFSFKDALLEFGIATLKGHLITHLLKVYLYTIMVSTIIDLNNVYKLRKMWLKKDVTIMVKYEKVLCVFF